jgi:ribosome biogenesis protein UTP30
VVGLDKLKKKYKTYESRRQLQAEYDIFLADDRIITELARVLGKPFLANKTKRPIPVTLAQQLPKDKDGKRSRVVKKPEEIAKEIENALKCTYVHLSPTATTSVRVGRSSQSPQQIQDNVAAVVESLTTKFIPQGWRNVRGLYIKGPTTAALPIWLTDELWTSEEKVLEEPWKPTITGGMSARTSEKKRKWDEWEEEVLDEDELAEKRSRTRTRKAKKIEAGEKKELASISKEKRKKLKQEALKSVQTPLIAS